MKKLCWFILFSLASAGLCLAAWSSDPMMNFGVAVKPDAQVQPKIVPAPYGGCYISWFDNDPNGHPPFGYDVYLQRLNARGYRQFAPGGLLIADLGMSSTQDYGLDINLDGNALLAFLDDRKSPGSEVTVAAVTPDGEQVFGPGGRTLTHGTDFFGNPKVTHTSDGQIVAGWIDNNDLGLQRLKSDGSKMWGPDGIKIVAPSGLSYSLADLHAADDGSVIVSWVSAAGFSGPKHLFANKIARNGTLLWGADGVAVFDGGSLQFGNFPSFVPDRSGGAVFGWYQVDPLQSRAQHILADGTEAFPHNGSLGSTNTAHDQVNPSVSYDVATDTTYLFWDEILEGPLTNEGINGQKFDSQGNRQWGDDGVVVQPFTSSAVLNVTSVFMSAGPLVVWSSEAAFAQDSIYGAKLDPSGAFLCTPFDVSSILSSKSRLNMTLTPRGTAVAVWSDGRADDGDIYAQDIKPDCTLGE